MNNKQMSWVPVLQDDNSNIYVPGQYETVDIYQGKDSLPMYDNKEECEQWCHNHSQNFYVNRWLKALKYLSDEHNQPSLKPGDYIQIKEVVDGIGLGYVDGKKHLLFNTKYLNSYLTTNFELMSDNFNHVAPKVGDVTHKGVIDTIGNCANCGVELHIHKDKSILCKCRECVAIVEEITELENQSFEGWSNDAIDGYLTACKTIKEKLYHVA